MKTVLFDFDGVLVRGDSFALFLRRRALPGWRAALVLAALPVVVALAVTPGQWPRAARLVTRIGTLGVPADVLERRLADFGRQVAREPGRVVGQGVDAVRRHLAAGDRVVVVTACEQTLARSVLGELGLASVEVIGSSLAGRGVHNRGAEKVRQLAARGIVAPWDVAYSDSTVDLPLLGGARRAVLVNGRRADIARLGAALAGRLEVVSWPVEATGS